MFLLVIPGRANGSRECAPDDRLRGEPGIHDHDRAYGFRAWPFGPSRNDDGVDSMPNSENLPRLRGARDLAPGAEGTGDDRFDQLAVRRHLGAVREIEGILEPGAQMSAEFGAALVQRPDLGAADRGDLPMRLR